MLLQKANCFDFLDIVVSFIKLFSLRILRGMAIKKRFVSFGNIFKMVYEDPLHFFSILFRFEDSLTRNGVESAVLFSMFDLIHWSCSDAQNRTTRMCVTAFQWAFTLICCDPISISHGRFPRHFGGTASPTFESLCTTKCNFLVL